MKRISLVSALFVLGFAGAAYAGTPDMSSSGPHSPNPPKAAPDLQAQMPCPPEGTFPNEVVTKPKSGDLSGAPSISDAGNHAAQLAQNSCPNNGPSPAQPNATPPRG